MYARGPTPSKYCALNRRLDRARGRRRPPSLSYLVPRPPKHKWNRSWDAQDKIRDLLGPLGPRIALKFSDQNGTKNKHTYSLSPNNTNRKRK